MARSRMNELRLEAGSEVLFQGQTYVIEEVLGLSEARIRHGEAGQSITAALAQLQPPSAALNKPDIPTISEERWRVAQERYEVIKPLLANTERTKHDVQAVAAEHGLSSATLYRWLALFEESNLLTSLLPPVRADKAMPRIVPHLESLITNIIHQEYLTSRKKSPKEVYRRVIEHCLNSNVTPPSRSTVYRRIQSLPKKNVVTAREGAKKARQRFSPVQGEFPGADFPLAVIQIDHTLLDIILVDDAHRSPIGRPWITLAIDVHSRMVVGFYISFDPPGALAVGMCLAHSFLPKEKWLAARSIEGEWPCWGLPATVHADNAREFRGKMLQQACQEYGINIEWRPVARPNFGGHIERLLGTFGKEIHTLPGTTFSNPRERGDYRSDKEASLTLSELETWLGTYIVGVYHRRVHSGIDMSPLKKYRHGLLGDKSTPGRGLPPRVADEERLRLDFMPFVSRSVQAYGVVIDHVHYYHDVLRPWINATDPKNPKHKRMFTFRRDPRDISALWFYDPELGRYYPIPYRDISLPPVSIWEFREARRRVRAAGKSQLNERAIFQAYERMREIEETAEKSTKASRRAKQRRVEREKNRVAPVPAPVPDVAPPIQEEPMLLNIQPFDDLEEL